MSEPLIKSMKLRCSVDHAFSTFTTMVDHWWPPGHRKFESSELSLDFSVHGQLIERAANGDIFVIADVLACDPPNTLSMAWHPGKVSLPTEVLVTFEKEGEFAIVRVIHSEGASELGLQWAERVALFATGWSAVLAALSDHIGIGRAP